MSGKHTSGSHLAHTNTNASSGYPAKPSKPKKKARTPVIIAAVLAGLVLLILLGAFIVFQVVYGSMNIQKDGTSLDFSQIDLDAILNRGDEDPVEGAVILSDEEVAALQQELMNNLANNELLEDSSVYNILLLGNDSRSNNINERSDVMLLVSINTESKGIVLTSFMRDIYIYIPGYFSHRLNTANALAGPSLTVDTIEQNFGIAINNYAEVNFIAFAEIIDTLGGVDIELSAAEARVVGCGSSGGTYHLNGDQALAYCRIRKLDSDFGRTERQRKLMTALWEDMKDINLTKAYSLMDTILPQVTTDLSQADCLSLLSIVLQISDYELYSTRVPADGTYSLTMIDGMSVIRTDISANHDHLMNYIYNK